MSVGAVTSATIIANAPLADEALAGTVRFPQCSFGVHLNLSEFSPLSPSPGLQPLLNDRGEFDGDAVRTVRITQKIQRAVYEEWLAQIQRVAASGTNPSHLDSHHHVHTVPGLFPVLKSVQRHFGIRKVRNTKNIYGPTEAYTHGLLIRKRLWSFALRTYYRSFVAAGFTSFREFHDLSVNGELPRWFRRGFSDATIVELMVHPGNTLFANETEILASGWLGGAGVTLASYNDVSLKV